MRARLGSARAARGLVSDARPFVRAIIGARVRTVAVLTAGRHRSRLHHRVGPALPDQLAAVAAFGCVRGSSTCEGLIIANQKISNIPVITKHKNFSGRASAVVSSAFQEQCNRLCLNRLIFYTSLLKLPKICRSQVAHHAPVGARRALVVSHSRLVFLLVILLLFVLGRHVARPGRSVHAAADGE